MILGRVVGEVWATRRHSRLRGKLLIVRPHAWYDPPHQVGHIVAVDPVGAGIGRVVDAPDAMDRYLRHAGKAATTTLDGLKVVVDCAHGAAWAAAPQAYRGAGAEVIAISAEPNGLNINDGCGSTHLDALSAAVIAHGADLGLAHDGDADRCLAVDATGKVVDGDAIMVVLAKAMQDSGELASNTLVATVMSNQGLHLAMREAGIEVRTTGVGDRYVLEELVARGWQLGGEGSGHLLALDKHTTGDGIVSCLLVLQSVIRTGRSLADQLAEVQLFPQHMINVRLQAGQDWRGNGRLEAEQTAVQAELGALGRVLIRASGTEPLLRVMVEAADAGLAQRSAERLAAAVRAA